MRFILALVLISMLFSCGAVAVSAFDGYYCEQAASARGMNLGWNFLCAWEVAMDIWADHFGDANYRPF